MPEPPSNGTPSSPDSSLCDQLARRVIENEPIITKYKELVEKGRRLNIEFLKGSWPDFYSDQAKLNEVTNYILSLKADLSSDQVLRVFDRIRHLLGYSGDK